MINGRYRYTKLIALLIIVFTSGGLVFAANENTVSPVAVTTSEVISTDAIYNDVNAARHDAGAQLLSLNPVAIKAAEEKCQDMVTNDYYDHKNPTTGEVGYIYAQRLIKGGVWFNENLNQGNLTTNQAWVESWLNSPGHKATMLNPRFTDTGLAICHRNSQPPDSKIIVQEFVEIPHQTN